MDGVFEAELPLEHEAFRFGTQPLPVGDHDVDLRVRTDEGDLLDVGLKMSPDLNTCLPVPVQTPCLEGRIVRGPAGILRTTLVPPLGDARGSYRQEQSPPCRAPGRTLTRGMLFRSYFGEHATDNGVSIQKELRRRGSDLPVYWAVHDHSVRGARGRHPRGVNTPEWYALLTR